MMISSERHSQIEEMKRRMVEDDDRMTYHRKDITRLEQREASLRKELNNLKTSVSTQVRTPG